MRRFERLLLATLAISLLAGVPAHANLIITPTFDSSITGDLTNGAAIQATINSAINIYENMFGDPINVTIEFQEMGSGLGQSQTDIYNLPYSTFYTALAADAKTTDDATAIAHLTPGPDNPVVPGNTGINVKPANLRAVGINCCPSTLPGGYDGIIGLNTSITNISRTGPQDPNKYDLMSVAMHEIDEVLGLGSALPSPFLGSPSSEDLFRYTSTPGVRSFTATTSARAYFSIDGTTLLDEFDNLGNGDYGDWRNGITTPQVQDAAGTPGAQPNLGVELRALDVIGYDLIEAPEPATWALMIGAFAFIGALKFKKLGVHSTGV